MAIEYAIEIRQIFNTKAVLMINKSVESYYGNVFTFTASLKNCLQWVQINLICSLFSFVKFLFVSIQQKTEEYVYIMEA